MDAIIFIWNEYDINSQNCNHLILEATVELDNKI